MLCQSNPMYSFVRVQLSQYIIEASNKLKQLKVVKFLTQKHLQFVTKKPVKTGSLTGFLMNK